MIRTVSAVVVSACLMAACGEKAAEPASAPAASTSKTPVSSVDVLTSDGYGPLRIGMTKAEVISAMGDDSAPNAVGGPEPETCDQWRPARAPEGMLVMVQNGVLTRISVSKPSTLKTDHGFGVGDTAAAIKAAYGTAAVSQPHKYSEPPAEDIFVWTSGAPVGSAYVENPAARGVRYEIGVDGKVEIIHVGGPDIQLVEGCA